MEDFNGNHLENPECRLPKIPSEIEENGVLYSTILKKVRYSSLNFTDNPDTSGDISYKQWETVRIRQIKAATLEKLVEYLTSGTIETNECDSAFLLAFLCTYKSFAETRTVVELLLKRIDYCENNLLSCVDNENHFSGIIRRICYVITVWFDKYPDDFDEPPNYPTMSNIINFTEKRSHLSGMLELQNCCSNSLDKLRVSPFDYVTPFKFKFCSCPSIVGCTCEISVCSATLEEYKYLNMMNFSAELIAEELTLADAELFIRVSPRECLGSFWSKRDRSKGSMSQSIKLTVDQFNTVSLKVISTILSARNKITNNLSASSRAKVIEKWIEVALELRELKNFSSLKAILGSLQSVAIYRLTRTWNMVNKQSIEIYEGLSEIFSHDMNQKASRDLLVQEGTAKYSTHSLNKSKSKSKRDTWKREGVTHGTVPYLGLFLTDLMMIDAAHPDKRNGDLINFEKRRKEFEILIQITLLQQTAKNYHIKPCKDFFVWFNAIPEYSENEGYNKSVEVEPPMTKNLPLPSTPQPKRKNNIIKRCKSESDILHEGRNNSSLKSSVSSVSSSKSSLLLVNNLNSLDLDDKQTIESLSPRNSLTATDMQRQDSFLVIRVYLEDSIGACYKSIQISSETRACDVISISLRKFNATEEPTQFSLYQFIDKKTLHIPMNSNMYYAINKSKELCFKICKKKLGKKWKKGLSSHHKPPVFYECPNSNAIDTDDHSIMFRSYSPL